VRSSALIAAYAALIVFGVLTQAGPAYAWLYVPEQQRDVANQVASEPPAQNQTQTPPQNSRAGVYNFDSDDPNFGAH
jgi:hypothetical protein